MAAVTLLQKWQLLQAILADAELPATAKLVAARLLYHHSAQTGRCSPSYQTVADGIALQRRAVIRAVQDLEARGWLIVSRVKGGDPSAAQGFVTNGFRINFDRSNESPPVHGETLPPVSDETLPPGAPGDTPPGVSQDTPGVSGEALPPVSGETPNSGKDTGKGNREESPPTPSAFDEWWETYPRRDGKIAARKAFDRALKDRAATVEELIAGARRYADSRAGQDPKFTKVPTTWLNGGHWADEPAPRHTVTVANGRQSFSALDALRRNLCDDE
ncbi:helix-turn-helix domain-containing protein [Methylobacterium sp. J-088]|uniref:helix-turn-helix domain-containing protein n=1 Tax=Methylobacterium sp. J-088 TaxID=2836664 RepID=UPI001FB9D6FC|nr:helix-turn-helix domain-containing protein [Methylobacterium sp. J-088]MCJ2065036.1 helix-turn-helix domain-containing protein [Methylobacterium sp. J-088]